MNAAIHLVGGAGACLVGSALVAASLDRGERAVLVDVADAGCAWLPGADVVLGIDHRPGVRWNDLADADGRLDAAGLARRLPSDPDGRCALAGSIDRPAAAVLAAGLAATRAAFDVTVTIGPAPQPQLHRPGDLICVVAESDLLSLAAAVSVTERLTGIDHHTVVLGRRADRRLLDQLTDPVHPVQLTRGDLRDLTRGRLCRGRSLRALAEHLLEQCDPSTGVAA